MLLLKVVFFVLLVSSYVIADDDTCALFGGTCKSDCGPARSHGVLNCDQNSLCCAAVDGIRCKDLGGQCDLNCPPRIVKLGETATDCADDRKCCIFLT